MNFEDIEAIIDFAIEKEREAAVFYESISKDEEDFSGSKKMFAEFAVEEQKHEKILQDFKTGGISKSLEEYQLKWITDIKRSDYMVDLSYEKGMPYNEILLLAMKREEKRPIRMRAKSCLKCSVRKKPNTSWPWRPSMMTIWLKWGISI
jgi:rubrerythrin